MLINKSAYKRKTLYKGLYEINKICTNGMVTLQIGYTTKRLKIH